MSSNLSIDARRVFALVLALVVVASMSGSATVALLSDRESIAVGLTASNANTDTGSVSGFDVEPLDTCTVDNATANQRDLRAAAKFDVEGDGCAKLSVWVSESWLDRTGEDVDDVVIGHKDSSGWAFLETAVGEQRHGWYELTATTTGFSPFGLFVPNESRASPAESNAGDAATALDSDADVNQTENESVGGNRTVAGNDTERNGSVGGTQVSDAPEQSDGNGSVPANGSAPTNETAGDDATQNGTAPSNGADSNGTESGSDDDETTTDGEAEAETTESAASDPETTETAETGTPKPETTETGSTESASTPTATEDGETTATPSSQDA